MKTRKSTLQHLSIRNYTGEAVLNLETIYQIHDDLDKEFRVHPGNVGWVGAHHARARKVLRHLKDELSLIYAKLAHSAPDKMQSKGKNPKWVTKYAAEAWILAHVDYRSALKKCNDAQYKQELLKSVVDALEHKKDALKALSWNIRTEMDPEMRAYAKGLKEKM